MTERGILDHIPGETFSQAIFQSPLEGKFEVHADITTQKSRAAFLTYGMHGSLPREAGNPVQNKNVFRSTGSSYEEEQIPDWGGLVHLKMEIEDSTARTFINGTQIHEEVIEGRPDPWLMLHPDAPGGQASIRNLRIIGEPKIPDSINLSETDMSAWHTSKFGETFSSDKKNKQATWIKDGDELLGRIVNASLEPDADGKLESLLTYQRPFLEDGEFEFESFYQKGKFECNPAVGSSAFLVQPDGIWLHDIAGDPWKEVASTDDSLDGKKIAGSKAVPLKDNEWNKFVIRMAGNQLTMIVNGEEVLEYEIKDPIKKRQFGFFRYADKFECRIRRMKYKGQWPTELPSVDSQELAYPSTGVLAVGDKQASETLTFDLTRPQEELAKAGLKLLGPADQISVSEEGMLMKAENASEFKDWPGVSIAKKFGDDFDVTIDFKKLSLSGIEKGWGLGFDLEAFMADSEETIIGIGVQGDKDGKQFAKSLLSYQQPNGKRAYEELKRMDNANSGRLRLSRRGRQIYCLFAPQDKEFELIESFIVGQENVKEIRISAKCSDKKAVTEVTSSKLILDILKP